MSVSIRNERVKLIATLLNTVAGHSVSLGVLAPLVAVTYGTGPPNNPVSNEALLAGIALFLIAGFVLHWLASFLLRELRDDQT